MSHEELEPAGATPAPAPGGAAEQTGLAVPSSMIEPAQAIESATGIQVADSAIATATAVVNQNIVVTQHPHGPGFVVRAVWFFVIGWWLTGLAIGFAWVCALTVILLPISFLIVSKIPTILTLRSRSVEARIVVGADGSVQIATGRAEQLPFWQRALWFLFVGWWACGLAMFVAYLMSLTIVLLPVGLLIFNRVPAVMTLQRN